MTHRSVAHADVAMDQSVADRFGALVAAICASADDWRRRAAEAVIDLDDARVQECLAAIQCITEAATEVEGLYRQWKAGWPAVSPTPAPGGGRHPGPATRLRVHLNSKLIEYPHAAETFARTIAEIGIDRVASLAKVLAGIPLVGTSKAPGYQGQFAIGGFYVCTHSDTQLKKRILEEIAAKLGVPIRVEITSARQTPSADDGSPIP